MINSLEIRGFKSLERVRLDLKALNLFIGTNASGKSNFFDALRVLQGIGYGFTVDEILNGKPKSATSEVWEPIRGGGGKAQFVRRSEHAPERNGQGDSESLIEFDAHFRLDGEGADVRYNIAISADQACVRREQLVRGGKAIFDSTPRDNPRTRPVLEVQYAHGKKGTQPVLEFEKSRPVLTQLARHDRCLEAHRRVLEGVIRTLGNVQRLDPSPAVLREYSKAQAVRRMGERGENFAALVKTITADPKTKSAYLSWLTKLTPMELDDVEILPGALQEPLFALVERGMRYPAPILSDGTLRFAAISAAFFQPDMPDILTIEEIENGIHPSRLKLLVQLLKSRRGEGGLQVMATTHSPIVLSWLEESDYESTFLCNRDEESGASIIRPLSEVPMFNDIVAKQPIADLFSELWLEAAV